MRVRKILVFHWAGNHTEKVYLSIDKECFYCKNKGNTTKICTKKDKGRIKGRLSTNLFRKQERSLQSDEDLYNVFQVSKLKPTTLLNIEIIINKVDTGASIS